MAAKPKDIDWSKELRKAVLKGKIQEATLALERGAKREPKNFKGKWSNVHFAARQNKPQVLKLLIQHGGDVNKKSVTAQHHSMLLAVPDFWKSPKY